MAGALGKLYDDGELIIRQGESGDCMFVIQDGQVEVFTVVEGKEVSLAVRGEGDFVGEMAIFGKEVRSANVRAKGPTRLLTVDKKNLMTRIHDDPSLAFRLIQILAGKVRELSSEVAQLKAGQ